MLNAPSITFRSASAPYNVISSIGYVQSTLGGGNLPLPNGENSNLMQFRIYNNWNLAGGIATMQNVFLTVYDDSNPASHSGAKSPVSQSWVRVYESGFGENSSTPGLYTRFVGTDTAIGRSGLDIYAPELGSDGSTNNHIRAGTNTNGTGFIEFYTYTEMPEDEVVVGFANYSLAISLIYDWSS